MMGAGVWHGYTHSMHKLTSTDVVACARVVDMLVPNTRSFMSQCAQCRARIWVEYTSPIEPMRMCALCSLARAEQIKQSDVPH